VPSQPHDRPVGKKKPHRATLPIREAMCALTLPCWGRYLSSSPSTARERARSDFRNAALGRAPYACTDQQKPETVARAPVEASIIACSSGRPNRHPDGLDVHVRRCRLQLGALTDLGSRCTARILIKALEPEGRNAGSTAPDLQARASRFPGKNCAYPEAVSFL
jgi:hypothetical protein